MKMIHMIKYILLSSARDKFFIGFYILLFLTVLFASFLGYTTISEEQQNMSVLVAGMSRITIIGGFIIFISFQINKMFLYHEIDFLLSKPISRKSFLFSYLITHVLIAFITTLIISTILLLFFYTNKIGLLYWSISLLIESSIVITFAAYFITTIK